MNKSGRATLYLLTWLLLVSCAPVPLPTPSSTAPPTVSPTASATATPSATAPPTASPTISPTAPPTLSSVEYLKLMFPMDEDCPHFCWSGINPGVTSAQEAQTLLGDSLEFQSVALSDTQMRVIWADNYPVTVQFENGLVNSMDLEGLEPFGFTTSDFIQLLGKPDGIRLAVWNAYHCHPLAYLLYFSSRKIVVEIANGGSNGPHPSDWMFGIALNVEFDDTFFQVRDSKLYDEKLKLSESQPWLGYGQLLDYLPGRKESRTPCLTPDPQYAP